MEKVIVTGANGFIGSSLIKKLVEKGIRVTAIDRSFVPDHLPQSSLVTRLEMDIAGIEKLKDRVAPGFDAFYHLAWRGVNGPEKADPAVQSQNITMTMGCAAVAKQLVCRKFLCAGTIAEQAVNSLGRLEKTGGGMLYGTAKHCARLLLESYSKNIGLDFVWMQFSNIYGPENKTGNLVSYTLAELAGGKEASFGPAMQPYDFIYVDDLVEAVFRLGSHTTSRNFYYIGSGEPRLLKDFLLEIGAAYGRQDLIKVGVRPDDGIVYTLDMFDCGPLVKDIGVYVTKPFSQGIRFTIDNY